MCASHKDKLAQALRELRANLNKSPILRNRTVDEVLALDLTPQSAITARKKWSRFEQFLSWAVSHGHLAINVAAGKKPKAKASSYEKFTADDLKALFEAPHYREHEYDEPFKYWLPVLGLYTGARLEELAQLHLADVKQHASTGIWCIDITEDVDEENGADERKNLKNAASVRACPIHSRVLELGFLQYVEALKTAGFRRTAVSQARIRALRGRP
jgi:integrase